MPRKSTPIGPNTLSLIEDARIDLARDILAVREGENEPEFELPELPTEVSDESAIYAFRQ